MTTEQKFYKIKELADAMYYEAHNLTTDASALHKAMDNYHQFIVQEWHKEEPKKFKPVGKKQPEGVLRELLEETRKQPEVIIISRSLALKIRAALHIGGMGLQNIVKREAYGLPFCGGTYYSYKSSQLLKLSKTIDKKIKEL